MTVDRPKLLELHAQLGNKAREIMTAKNQDYAHESDVFRNFRRYGTLGVLVRLSDKLARLDSFEENKTFAVADEKLIDTIVDLINYAVIYYAMKQENTAIPDATGYSVQDGPYCKNCDQLAEFRYDCKVLTDGPYFLCSSCRAETGLPLDQFTVMGRL